MIDVLIERAEVDDLILFIGRDQLVQLVQFLILLLPLDA